MFYVTWLVRYSKQKQLHKIYTIKSPPHSFLFCQSQNFTRSNHFVLSSKLTNLIKWKWSKHDLVMCINKIFKFYFPSQNSLPLFVSHINDQFMKEKAKQWTLLSSASTFHATAWSYDACRPIVDMQIPAGMQAKPWRILSC